MGFEELPAYMEYQQKRLPLCYIILWIFDLTHIMNAVQVKRQAYLREAGSFFENASVRAGEGDLQTSAGFILKALDQERRARGVGPQVLHLIKTK